MSKTASAHRDRPGKHFVVLDGSKDFPNRLGEDGCMRVSRTSELAEALEQSSGHTVWIVMRSRWTELLLEAACSRAMQQQRSMILGDLLMLQPAARPELVPSLHGQFRRVVGEVPNFRILPLDQLAEVLSSNHKADLFVGGVFDQITGTLTLARGDLTTLVVPVNVFNQDGACKPDFSRFDVDDYGYTLRFGEYEASAHSVLYRLDPAYRRRARRQRIAEERGFGASLRRLRILRRLSRDDFPGVSSKTIARIERGETERPQGKTLQSLAKTLKVAPADIETY